MGQLNAIGEPRCASSPGTSNKNSRRSRLLTSLRSPWSVTERIYNVLTLPIRSIPHASALRAWPVLAHRARLSHREPGATLQAGWANGPTGHRTPFPRSRCMHSCVRRRKLAIRCVIWPWYSFCFKPACALANVPRSPGEISVLEKSRGRCLSAMARATKRGTCPEH